jgi:uncharacterized protein
MRPFSLLIKPTGPDCNLACTHCFYARKTELFGQGPHRISDEVLQTLVRDYLALQLPQSGFCWQGGEPTLVGFDFFKKVVELQQKYGRPGQVVSNSLQTNGTLLDDDWCKFLRKYNFLVGISLDGPKELHDHYRTNATGQGSFGKVMQAIQLCKDYRTEFNILVLLTDYNAERVDELFAFFVEQKIRYLQFIPCVEKEGGQIASYSITPMQYGQFLCRLLDLWLANKPEKMSIRLFDSLISYLVHGQHTVCTFSKRCDDYVVVEHNGDVFACDFFVEPHWRLGNVLERPIDQLALSEKKRQFADAKCKVCNNCFVCRHFALCRGGCLKERLLQNDDYQEKSFFCQSYQMFFDYALPKLMQLLPSIVKGKS